VKFRKLIAIITLFVYASNVFPEISARNIAAEFNSLTEQQKLEILSQVQKATQENNVKTKEEGITAERVVTTIGKTIDNLPEFAEKGKAIGQGIAAAAKEVGVGVSEFMQTPVGILTTAIIV
jgi:hypothetical protein